MTDNEIIKTLDCCIHSCCVGCPCADDDAISCNYDKKDVLDLINRQKAIIEKSEKVEHFADKAIETANAEIERLNIELQSMRSAANSYKMHYVTAKSEAIKEFAEEIEYFVLNEDIEVVEPKCKDYESYINGANQFRHQIKNGINNLIKEKMK